MLRDNRKGSKEMDENTLLLKEILKQLYILNQKIEALNTSNEFWNIQDIYKRLDQIGDIVSDISSKADSIDTTHPTLHPRPHTNLGSLPRGLRDCRSHPGRLNLHYHLSCQK